MKFNLPHTYGFKFEKNVIDSFQNWIFNCNKMKLNYTFFAVKNKMAKHIWNLQL